MKSFKQHLTEARSGYAIVVDVQPEYSTWIDFEYELMEYLNKQRKILMMVNSDAEGLTRDSIPSIKDYWVHHGFENLGSVEVIDKGYGYLRGWMDQGVSEHTIIKTIREMYKQKVTDSRDLFIDRQKYKQSVVPSRIDMNAERRIGLKEFLGSEYKVWMEDEGISTEWVSVKKLKQYSGAYIMGGAKDKCLKEVELLMSAFNIRSTRINKFVYKG